MRSSVTVQSPVLSSLILSVPIIDTSREEAAAAAAARAEKLYMAFCPVCREQKAEDELQNVCWQMYLDSNTQQHSCQRHFADAAAHTVFNCPAVQFRAARYECQIRTEVEADRKKETNRRYGKKQAEEAEKYPQQTTNQVVVVVEVVVVVVLQTRTQKIVLDAAAADADVIQDWNTNLESTSRSPERES